MGLADYKYLLETANAMTTAEYTTDEVYMAETTPGWNRGGNFGLNIVVTTAFTGLDSGIYFWLIHGAATSPTTKHSGIFVSVTALTAGAYFFVPAGRGVDLLQYVRGYKEPVSEAATAGATTSWLGPPTGDM